MRVCIDVDGTICITKAEHESYADVVPMPGAIETIKKLNYLELLGKIKNRRTAFSPISGWS